VILISIIFAFNLFSLEITDCNFEGKNFFTLEFNNSFKIQKIKYNKNILEMPYTKFSDKKFKDLFIYSKDLYQKIENSIQSCKKSVSKQFPNVSYTVFDIKKLKSQKRVANITVLFDNSLNVVFGVVKMRNFYLVYPPSFFKFVDENFKKEVFNFIIKKYTEMENL
jgi:glucose-6-phosphate 1-dehydrogenase